jgi:hypothetical protein
MALGFLGPLQCFFTVLLGVDPCVCGIWGIGVVAIGDLYGLTMDVDKPSFLDELHELSQVRHMPWVLCGNFNMIYRAQDKNNDRLQIEGAWDSFSGSSMSRH